MKNIMLKCTACERTYTGSELHIRCEECGEPLEFETVKRGKIREGNILTQTIAERYADFFPFIESEVPLSLGEGFTPLVESKNLAEEIGIKNLYFKNESQNPTWSFKDRGTLIGALHAVKLEYKKIGTVSTGNMAVSVAAYGSKAGLQTFVFVNKNIAPEKLNPIAIYNPHLIRVDGDYGDLYFESLRMGKENAIYFLNSDVPSRVEGSKTIAYEICEQLNFDIPDYIVVPTSAGGNIRGIEKGFREFKLCGYIDRVPKFICAQAGGCSPIYNGYRDKQDQIVRVENPNTIAHAIENPFPPSGNQVLRSIRQHDGICVAVSDDEIIEAQKQLAQQGVFGQPASAVPLAAIKRLKKENQLQGNERIACIVTGSGLKYTAVFEKHNLQSCECKLDNLSEFISNQL